jgi:hypothetical protein
MDFEIDKILLYKVKSAKEGCANQPTNESYYFLWEGVKQPNKFVSEVNSQSITTKQVSPRNSACDLLYL